MDKDLDAEKYAKKESLEKTLPEHLKIGRTILQRSKS